MRIVVAGSVSSSLFTLEKLIQHDLAPVAVFGLKQQDVSSISGYADMEPTAKQAGIPFHPFKKINDHSDQINSYKPDLLFVVGLSQLVSKNIIDCPTYGCVGFHPTKLPLGRGRAPVAWIILDDCPAAATFFKISEGVDDGPIYVQTPFNVDLKDDAESVMEKLLAATGRALDRWLPEIRGGNLSNVAQDHGAATYYEKRTDRDGELNWSQDMTSINRLIRATTRPHPGAYTRSDNVTIRIWKSEIENRPMKSSPGTITKVNDDGSFLVQTATGQIHVIDYSTSEKWRPVVGAQFRESNN